MNLPMRATYRLQLRNGMGFAGARAILPYLAALGISHLYLSPIFKARTGSTHGYDAVDPRVIDPVLGGEEGFIALCDELKRLGMGLLLDIVPNHLGIGAENPWWDDLLARGEASEGAAFFDIDWQALAGGTPGKVLLPFLGAPYGEVLEAGELEPDGAGRINYFEASYPLAPGTAEGAAEDLHATLEKQHWRLAHWRCGNAMLNWRRFFDITELVGVRVEDEPIFEATHATLLRHVAAGRIDVLRVDHIDGLARPGTYLERLDRALADAGQGERRVLVEKILAPDEDLPESWRTAGTSGYEMLNALLRFLIAPDGMARIDETFRAFGGDPEGFPALVAAAKREVLTRNLEAETTRLTRRLLAAAGEDLVARDLPERVLREALLAVMVAFPAYRTYGSDGALGAADMARLDDAFAAAGDRADGCALAFLRRALSTPGPLLQAFEQLTGPAMAKALEDTAFYRWHRLVALNEVGGEPHHAIMPVPDLHAMLRRRAARWPEALVASATHDTKRGEDTRLRIAALSHVADLWSQAVAGWRELNARHRDGPHPSSQVEYLIYQTLVGIWPMETGADAALEERLCAYLQKALREAKQETSWLDPDTGFEETVFAFVRRLLGDGSFTDGLDAFCRQIAPLAMRLSLAQTLLKLTVPGVPDIYQGTELWDQSLVDPDNRRPVDFAERMRLLGAPGAHPKFDLIRDVLELRRQAPALFTHGAYLPLEVTGRAAGSTLAFARLGEDDAMAIVVVQRPSGEAALAEGHVVLPPELASRDVVSVLDGGAGRVTAGSMPLSSLLSKSGIALLAAIPRSAQR